MKRRDIDSGQTFDFGRTAERYGKYRDIYPQSLYDRLISLGIGKPGQLILDLGSGTAVLPINLSHTGAHFTATDIAENQVRCGEAIVRAKGLDNIAFKVCSAEDTGFAEGSFDAVTAVQCFQYFDAEKAACEIHRVLRPGGLFCKIFMDWLPFEDEKIAEMERLVLRYNPAWSGGGFRAFSYQFPSWAQGRFTLETVESYDAALTFSKEAWLGRVLTCRGVGASLPKAQVAAFEREYRELLAQYAEPLSLKHQIHIELYHAAKE